MVGGVAVGTGAEGVVAADPVPDHVAHVTARKAEEAGAKIRVETRVTTETGVNHKITSLNQKEPMTNQNESEDRGGVLKMI